jgi:hypothetical protein
MKSLLKQGYIKASFSNDNELAPVNDINSELFHYYWFSPTDMGMKAWRNLYELDTRTPPVL